MDTTNFCQNKRFARKFYETFKTLPYVMGHATQTV